MTRKIITGVVAAVLVVTIAVFAAEKAKEKVCAEKPETKAGECCAKEFGSHERLLDELVEAYKANDRDKMGEIINKMQERREKMQEFAGSNRWQRWAHRMMMWRMEPRWGQGCQMPGQGFNQGCAMNCPCGNCCCAMQGPAWNQGCQMCGPQWGQFQTMNRCGFGGCNNMMGNCGQFAGPQNTMGWGCGPGVFNGMGNCGAMPGQNFGQMSCQQGSMGMNNCMPQQGGQEQMPGQGYGFQREATPGCGAENMRQQGWNTPRRERQNDVPPPEWGW